jgi:flagellar biosynthesis/type III secretory pathway M-ring protein FliF/YscJ
MVGGVGGSPGRSDQREALRIRRPDMDWWWWLLLVLLIVLIVVWVVIRKKQRQQ